MALAPVAGADPDQGALLPPDVEFSKANGGNVNAKIHNPNDRGVCWAENADTGALFDYSYTAFNVRVGPEQYLARPGKTSFVGLQGLSNGTVHVVGRCADQYPAAGDDPSASATEVSAFEVTDGGISLPGTNSAG